MCIRDSDFPPSHNPITRGAEADYFTLFEFSAKYDPVPTMLTQNHVSVIKGFMGQTTQSGCLQLDASREKTFNSGATVKKVQPT